ncbi:hypothetical protein, partial [Phocaeicola vulgatus]|uniref:hypothetical protein n=1 Tax=Phocaeicola vulgatus TaxID=821 RepID=UPI001C38AFE6
AAVLIEASGLEEVPEAFFVYARMKCGLYRFFPWVWVPFPRNSPEGSAMSFLRQGQVRKFCSVGDDVHKVSLFMSIQFASISKVIYIFADTLL